MVLGDDDNHTNNDGDYEKGFDDLEDGEEQSKSESSLNTESSNEIEDHFALLHMQYKIGKFSTKFKINSEL